MESLLYKTRYFHFYKINVCVYRPTYVYTYVILYIELRFSPACSHKPEINSSESVWICCSLTELDNLHTPISGWVPLACSQCSDFSIAGLCAMWMAPVSASGPHEITGPPGPGNQFRHPQPFTYFFHLLTDPAWVTPDGWPRGPSHKEGWSVGLFLSHYFSF